MLRIYFINNLKVYLEKILSYYFTQILFKLVFILFFFTVLFCTFLLSKLFDFLLGDCGFKSPTWI